MKIEELYKEKLSQKAKSLVEKHLEDVKSILTEEEYNEISFILMDVFVEGANCAKDIIIEITGLKDEQD